MSSAAIIEPAVILATPTLGNKYSGIPERLLAKATKAKDLVYKNQTLAVVPRKLVALPLGYPAEKFQEAILAIGKTLGAENVALNDQPLDDGW